MTTEKRTYKTSFIERFKDKRRRSLPFRLTSTLILTLLSIYIIIILSTYLVTSITTKKSTKQEVTLIAQKNANQIENILSRGDILVKSLGKYVENNINIDKKALENYIKFNIKDVVDNQSEFFALGITFEPYLFDTAKKDLSIYGYRDGNNITFSDLGSYDTYSKKEYYSLAKQRKKTVCSEPYIGKLPTNEEVWMITLSSPIYVNNKFLGTVLIDVDIRSFKKIKTDNLTYKTLSSFILTDKSTFVYHGLNSKLPGKNLKDIESKADLSLINTNIKNGVQFSVDDLSISTKKSTTNFYVPIKAGSSGNNWSSVVTIEKFDMNKSALLIGLILVTICILGLVIIIFIANRLINNSLSPINTMVNAANNISNGNLKIDIEVTTEDEMGALALAFSNTSNTLQSYISEISYILKNIADGNLNIEVKNDYNGDFQGIKTSMLDISNSLNYIIGNI
ncbi:MAG: cache domain-containing protein, partial [Clostridium sp.]